MISSTDIFEGFFLSPEKRSIYMYVGVGVWSN
jgi:hypothetical protein